MNRAPTPRQIEIAQLLADGLRVREIGEKLDISASTVRTHTETLLRVLDAHTTTQCVAIGFRQGWIK